MDHNNGNIPRGSFALSGAPNWLAAESVSRRRLPPRYSLKMHVQCQFRTAGKTGASEDIRVNNVRNVISLCQESGTCALMRANLGTLRRYASAGRCPANP